MEFLLLIIIINETPLDVAAEKNNFEIVELLLKKGADPNVIDYNGNYPLIKACCNNNIDIIKAILENTKDVNYENNKGIHFYILYIQ